MTTFTQLKQNVSKWLQRDDQDVLSQIPVFINNAEYQINLRCNNIGFERYLIASPLINGKSLTPGNPYVAKPIGFRQPLSMSIEANGNIKILNLVDINVLEMYWGDETERGVPEYYTEEGLPYIKIAPTPDYAYPFKINYIEFPQPLSDSNQTNWLTNYIPDILLYGSLLNAMPYVKNDTRVQLWQEIYDRRIEDLTKKDISRALDRSSNRMAV